MSALRILVVILALLLSAPSRGGPAGDLPHASTQRAPAPPSAINGSSRALPGGRSTGHHATGFGISLPASATIRQGGIITMTVEASGGGFAGGSFDLSSATSLNIDAPARLDGNGHAAVGYSFDNVSPHGANLTLFVGSQVPTGTYRMTVTGTAGGEAHDASFTLNVSKHGAVYEIRPGDGAYPGMLAKLKPGDELVLHQGTYSGHAELRVSGTRDKPIIIRGYGHGESKPILRYTGSSQNHWDIRASHLIVQGLEFETPASYSIRIRPASSGGKINNVSFVDNTFEGCGDGCVSANDETGVYRNIRMVDNLILDAVKTPVYIGDHHGKATFSNFLFEGNVVDARMIVAEDVVGYGIEVKLNVENAELRNNYIVGARGPAIMTYGLQANRNPDYRDVIEGNIVVGSCTDRNILVGAGPTLARGNLTMGGHSDGYGVYDYGNRHLSKGIQVSANTALLDQPNGFWVTSKTAGTGLENLKMTYNLAYMSAGGTGFKNLPASNGKNEIHDNTTQLVSGDMDSTVSELQHVVPSPQDLKAVWSMLAESPLDRTRLTELLDVLSSLPSQSSNNAPRTCGP